MSMRWRGWLPLLALPCAAAHAAGYELVDLSAVLAGHGHRIVDATHLNNRGEVVGTVSVPAARGSSMRAFRWRDGRVELLEPGPDARAGAFSKANAINDAGVVVGYGEFTGPATPAIWEPGQPPRSLQLPGRFSSASSINRQGAVAGSFTPDKSAIGFVAIGTEVHRIEPIAPEPDGKSYSEAYRINDNGQVIGRSSSATGHAAILWQAGQVKSLPTLPAHAGEGANPHATGINAAGVVVGCSSNKRLKETVPVLWDAGGAVRMLFDPRTVGNGASYGCAKAINAHGVVVGETWGPGGGGAFLWDAKSGYRDLREIADPSDHGWVRLRDATAINDRGEILGVAEGKGIGVLPLFLLRACEGWRCALPGRKVQWMLGGVLGGAVLVALLWSALRRRRRASPAG